MKQNEKDALSGQERAQKRSGTFDQFSHFHFTTTNLYPPLESFSDIFRGSAIGERARLRAPLMAIQDQDIKKMCKRASELEQHAAELRYAAYVLERKRNNERCVITN